MQVIEHLPSFKEQYQHCVATIGKYDGMHYGHQSILRQVIDESRALGLPSLVILSEPQPEEFFRGEEAPARLNHFEDKVAFLESFGIDLVYRMNFDYALSQLSAERFISEVLVSGLGVKSLLVGDDFHFGKARQGNFELLESAGESLGFVVSAQEPCCQSGERVSSTLVRTYLELGDCERVKQLLGSYYNISGTVVQGKQLGRELGVPTANIHLGTKPLPLQGVFAVAVVVGGKQLLGVANIGYKPTVDQGKVASLEVHIFDFEKDIYGEHMQVSFLKKIRNEMKFSGLDALKEQIKIDIVQAKNILSEKLSSI